MGQSQDGVFPLARDLACNNAQPRLTVLSTPFFRTHSIFPFIPVRIFVVFHCTYVFHFMLVSVPVYPVSTRERQERQSYIQFATVWLTVVNMPKRCTAVVIYISHRATRLWCHVVDLSRPDSMRPSTCLTITPDMGPASTHSLLSLYRQARSGQGYWPVPVPTKTKVRLREKYHYPTRNTVFMTIESA